MNEYYTLDESNNIVFLLYVLFYEDLVKYFRESDDLSVQYDEILEKIQEDDYKRNILSKVTKLIKGNKIEIIDGMKGDIKTIEVDPVSFFELLEKEGVKLSNDAKGAVRNTVGNIAEEKERQTRLSIFKNQILPKDEFLSLSNKEPLWDLSKSVLYISGYRSFHKYEYDYECICSDDELKKTYDYACDSRRIKELDLVSGIGSGFPAQYQVRPKDFISWAKKHFVNSPYFEDEVENKPNENKPSYYITPDMQLMFDAIEEFWSGYNLESPNPHVAPVKKEVVTWLLEEAKKRKIDFSKTRAENMDTIIRCPSSRRGGNTF